MVRNALGSVLALVGATAAVWSPFNAWYDGRHGRDYRIQDLFNGISDVKAELAGSLLLPFVFAALVTVVGVLLRSRLLVGLAGLVTLGFTILWMVRVGQLEGGLALNADGSGLGTGVSNALGGGVLLLVAAVVMRGRGRGRARRGSREREPSDAYGAPYAAEADLAPGPGPVPTLDRPGPNRDPDPGPAPDKSL
jgi:hypothetical protein